MLLEAHARWSEDAGFDAARLGSLRAQLSEGLAPLTRRRFSELAAASSLSWQGEFFRAFGVVGTLWRRTEAARSVTRARGSG